MMKIKIKYDGKYPNLCRGTLIVYVNGVKYDFGKNRLYTCGWYELVDYEVVFRNGEWAFYDFPEDFPKEAQIELIEYVNKNIPLGCCGGCE